MWHDDRRHLSASRLLHHYAAIRNADDDWGAPRDRSPDGSWHAELDVLDHLSDCPTCADRYHRMAADFDVLTSEDPAVDARLTPETMDRQYRDVMRRLENHGRRADVFIFPTRGRRPVTDRLGSGRPARWIAAAAVVGLTAGLGLGIGLNQLGSHPEESASSSLAAVAERASASRNDAASDDALLDEIDAALFSQQVPELLPYDELTPEGVNITYRLR